MNPLLILVKHALPVLDASRPAREWLLGPEGEAQALALAGQLRAFLPFRLVSSTEPKALRTAEIVASELGLILTPVDGLREFDRPVLPIMNPAEHERLNAEIFTKRDTPVLGQESANQARDRFAAAVAEHVRATSAGEHLVVIAHGTVITLLAGMHNPIDELALWKQLSCGSFVVLELPSMRLREVSAP